MLHIASPTCQAWSHLRRPLPSQIIYLKRNMYQLLCLLLLQFTLTQSLFPCILFWPLLTVGCADGNTRCTTREGIPQPIGQSCFYNACHNGVWSDVIPTEEGYECVDNRLVESTTCASPPLTPNCDFTGIQCLADEGILVNGTCTSRYQECVDGQLSAPTTLPGIAFALR